MRKNLRGLASGDSMKTTYGEIAGDQGDLTLRAHKLHVAGFGISLPACSPGTEQRVCCVDILFDRTAFILVVAQVNAETVRSELPEGLFLPITEGMQR
jgi:hypothetical protein